MVTNYMSSSIICPALLVSALASTGVSVSSLTKVESSDASHAAAAIAVFTTLGLVAHLPGKGCHRIDADDAATVDVVRSCSVLAGLLVVCCAWIGTRNSIRAAHQHAHRSDDAEHRRDYTRSVVNATLQGVTLALALAYLYVTGSTTAMGISAVIAVLVIAVMLLA